MGLEEHLLGMFRDDFEFHDGRAPSHLGEHGAAPVSEPDSAKAAGGPGWEEEAERELKKIPFFVRGKARRNTERFALDRGIDRISIETLYDAKAHFGR